MFVSEEECLIIYDQAFIYLSMQGNLILLQCIFYFRFLPQKYTSCKCTLKIISSTIILTFMLQNIAFLWFNCIFAFMYLYLRCENNEIDVKISTFGVRKFCVQLKRQVKVDISVKVFSTTTTSNGVICQIFYFWGQNRRAVQEFLMIHYLWFWEKFALSKFVVVKLQGNSE